MIILMNSTKTMDFERPAPISKHTIPEFADECENLVHQLRTLSTSDLSKLMRVSSKLARLNVDRYRNWQTPSMVSNAKQAILAFKGDIYAAMDIDRYRIKEFDFAQKHVRILSGLYGILRPLDRIQPYRLEMATKLSTDKGKNLYQFWGSRVNASLNAVLKKEKSGVLINLASLEYFKAVKSEPLNADVITPVFKEFKNQSYRVVTIYAKKARGMMCDYIIRNHITRVDALKSFDVDCYGFNAKLSSDTQWVFTRGDSPKLAP